MPIELIIFVTGTMIRASAERYWPFLSSHDACGASWFPVAVWAFYMKRNSDIRDKLLELRQIEAQAVINFNEAKNFLLKIRRQIRELEKLLSPYQN